MCPINSKNIGKKAETFARYYLEKQGLVFITQNYTCRLGEIDLIMQDKQLLVFIEVRYRRNINFGHSLETVHLRKQIKLIKTATHYLQFNPLVEGTSCRFDVVALSDSVKSTYQWFKKFTTSQHYPAQVEWVKNAFSR